jgi:hypothetical protein
LITTIGDKSRDEKRLVQLWQCDDHAFGGYVSTLMITSNYSRIRFTK